MKDLHQTVNPEMVQELQIVAMIPYMVMHMRPSPRRTDVCGRWSDHWSFARYENHWRSSRC